MDFLISTSFSFWGYWSSPLFWLQANLNPWNVTLSPSTLLSYPSIFGSSYFSRKLIRYILLIQYLCFIFLFNNDLHEQLWLQEERFLYPIYPLIGLSAAITWTCVESCLRALKLPEKFTQYLTFALVVSSSVISISRVVGQYRGIYKIWSIFCIACLMDPTIWMSGTGYHAPMDVFLELNRLSWESEGDKNNYNVCVGKEWHRFPSSFFLPNK